MPRKMGCVCGSANCKCGMIWGWLLILFGLVGLANNYGYPLLEFAKWWPAIFVVWGLKKAYWAYQK